MKAGRPADGHRIHPNKIPAMTVPSTAQPIPSVNQMKRMVNCQIASSLLTRSMS